MTNSNVQFDTVRPNKISSDHSSTLIMVKRILPFIVTMSRALKHHVTSVREAVQNITFGGERIETPKHQAGATRFLQQLFGIYEEST